MNDLEFTSHTYQRDDGWVGLEVREGARVLFSGKADTEEHAQRLADAHIRKFRGQHVGRVDDRSAFNANKPCGEGRKVAP